MIHQARGFRLIFAGGWGEAPARLSQESAAAVELIRAPANAEGLISQYFRRANWIS